MRGGQENDRLVAEIVRAAGGRIIGRVRLQKIFYLLDKIGLQSGFDYEYHYYGPYSAELVDAVDDAKAFDLLKESMHHRASDGVQYSVFEEPGVALSGSIGSLPQRDVERALALMQRETATVLEIAATINWLEVEEGFSDWRPELVRRKRSKAEADTVDRAVNLLRDLGLEH